MKGRIVFVDDEEFTFDSDLYYVDMPNRGWVCVRKRAALTGKSTKPD